MCNVSSSEGGFSPIDKGVNASIGKARKQRLVWHYLDKKEASVGYMSECSLLDKSQIASFSCFKVTVPTQNTQQIKHMFQQREFRQHSRLQGEAKKSMFQRDWWFHFVLKAACMCGYCERKCRVRKERKGGEWWNSHCVIRLLQEHHFLSACNLRFLLPRGVCCWVDDKGHSSFVHHVLKSFSEIQNDEIPKQLYC